MTEPQPLPVLPIYAVWITGTGWLRAPGTPGRIFADFSREKAETAARMLLPRDARVELFDEAMADLEDEFLRCEAARLAPLPPPPSLFRKVIQWLTTIR